MLLTIKKYYLLIMTTCTVGYALIGSIIVVYGNDIIISYSLFNMIIATIYLCNMIPLLFYYSVKTMIKVSK